jgi:hypothetical protein
LQISKDMILNMLEQRGGGDKVDQANQELPAQVDPERDSELLQKFGLKPEEVLSRLRGIPSL